MDHSDLRTRADAAALGFKLSRDDFSVRITHPDDQMFWIRIQPDMAGRPQITDAVRSGFGVPDMAIALACILQEAGFDPKNRLEFLDIGMQPEVAEAEFRPILGQFAKRRGRFLSGLSFSVRQGKTDMTASFTT